MATEGNEVPDKIRSFFSVIPQNAEAPLASRRRGRATGHREKVSAKRYRYQVVSSEPLPCWKHRSPQQIKQKMMSMAKEIEKQAIVRHQAEGTVPLSAHAVRRISPFHKPVDVDRSPCGLIHATDGIFSKSLRPPIRDL